MKLMTNKIIIAIVSFIALIGLLFVVYKFTNGPQSSPVSFPEVNKVLTNDHVKWATDSAAVKNILVEYSDLQCPACKSFHEYISQEIEATVSGNIDITKKVVFIYRHFPLTQIHQHAEEAAYAAEAAGKQNKFFAMTDILFNKQNEWENKGDVKDIFESYAKDLNLNVEAFRKDRDSQETKDKVSADTLSGEKAQINATPTFFLNGKKVEINSFDEFKRLLQNI